MEVWVEGFKILGAVLGLLAFLWKVWDSRVSYLHISVQVLKADTGISVKAVVENKSLVPKHLDYAAILIGPENESPVETATHIAKHIERDVMINHTNDIEQLSVDGPVYCDGGRALIPLPFFYSEQVRVADEILAYSSPISLDKFQYKANVPYSVRFFIFGRNRLHRSSQDLMLLS